MIYAVTTIVIDNRGTGIIHQYLNSRLYHTENSTRSPSACEDRGTVQYVKV